MAERHPADDPALPLSATYTYKRGIRHEFPRLFWYSFSRVVLVGARCVLVLRFGRMNVVFCGFNTKTAVSRAGTAVKRSEHLGVERVTGTFRTTRHGPGDLVPNGP